MYKVVHIAETLRGGIATYLREILPLQVAQYGDERVALIAPENQLTDLGELQGVCVFPVSSSKIRLVTAWRVRLQLLKVVLETPTCITHIHSFFAGVISRMPFFRKLAMGAVVYCPHGWAFNRSGRGMYFASYIERLLVKHTDAVVCVSKAEKEVALKVNIPEDKLNIIYNGLADRCQKANLANSYKPSSVLKLLFVGRFDQQKGFDLFIEALSGIKRNVEVNVFGDSVIHHWSIKDYPNYMHLHGWREFDYIEPYLMSCDALVMPSRSEGMPFSAIEAMRAGKAIIATNVGGLPELIEDGVSGFLVPKEDPVALAEVLKRVSANELQKMGEAGRERFLNEFTVERCADKLSTVYDGLQSKKCGMMVVRHKSRGG